MKKLRFAILIAFQAIAATWTTESWGQLTMTLVGQPGSSIIDFELSGSTILTTYSGNITGLGGNLTNFDAFSPVVGSVNLGLLELVSGSGSVTDVTKEVTVSIQELFLQDQSASQFFPSDRFGVTTPLYAMSVGDTMSWSGSGSVDLAQEGASFDNLTIGTGLGVVSLPTPSGAVRLIIQEVPEPRSITLMIMLFPLLAIITRRIGAQPAPQLVVRSRVQVL